MAEEKAKITKETTLGKILKLPGAEAILTKYNLPCLQCPMAAFEIGALKIGGVATTCGIEIDGLLKELNNRS